MSTLHNNNTIYIGNVASECTELDIYHLFIKCGPIKQVKIFSQIYQNSQYPIGYALVQFVDSAGYQACNNGLNFISFKNNLFKIYNQKPSTNFEVCIFVFFSNHKTTREDLINFFAYIRPTDVTIKSRVNADQLGFAIVEFPTKDLKNMALSIADDSSPYQIIAPSQNLILLIPSDSNRENSIVFQSLPSDIYDTDIYNRFMDLEIIHCQTPYRVNSYLASVYSTRINQCILTNSLLNRIETRIDIDGPFDLIQNSLLGQKIEINQDNALFVFLIAADLGMDSLISDATGLVLSQMTPELAMSIHRDLGPIEVSDGPHIRYMAENIDKMRALKEFVHAPTQLISAVLHSKRLSPRNLEVFCEWLIGFVNQNKEDRTKLMQYLPVQSLPRTIALDLVQDSTININLIRQPILSFLKSGVEANKESNFEVIRCQKDSDNNNYGVFATLCERCNGNPQDFGLVNVTGSTNVQLIIEPQENEYWSTPDMPNSWICFDFKNYEIIPSAYTLKTMVADLKLPYMVSWRIEGSRDGVHWTTLDERRNTTSSSDRQKQWRPWRIESEMKCRFFKLTQIDKNGSDNFCMFIHGIELFGKLPNWNVDIPYEPGKEWDGVFRYITRNEQCNPYENKRIDITTSCDPKYLIEEKWNGCWRSPKVRNSWIMIDLKAMKVDLRAYSLRTHYGPGYIQSWSVEVSENKVKWFKVDERKLRKEYNEPRQSITWECITPYADAVRYIKFTMTGESQKNEHIFWLSNIELYGDLLRPK